jgi:hypothetical protein
MRKDQALTKILRKDKRNLPVKLTDDEIKIAGEHLAKTTLELQETIATLTTTKKKLALAQSEFEETTIKLSNMIARKETDRLVDIEIQIIDNGIGGAVIREVRLDTGALLTEPRPATSEEVGQMAFTDGMESQ